MANFLELANGKVPIKCMVKLDGYDKEYMEIDDTIEGVGKQELGQAAAAWKRNGWSGRVKILPVEPKSFELLTDKELTALATSGTHGVIFFAVHYGLTDYATLEKFGYKLPKP